MPAAAQSRGLRGRGGAAMRPAGVSYRGLNNQTRVLD